MLFSIGTSSFLGAVCCSELRRFTEFCFSSLGDCLISYWGYGFGFGVYTFSTLIFGSVFCYCKVEGLGPFFASIFGLGVSTLLNLLFDFDDENLTACLVGLAKPLLSWYLLIGDFPFKSNFPDRNSTILVVTASAWGK